MKLNYCHQEHFQLLQRVWVPMSPPFEIFASPQWSDDAWYLDQNDRHFLPNDGHWILQQGEASGTVLGANLYTFNLLQETNKFD